MGKTAVLFSGGVDSTVAAHMIQKTGDLELLIALNTGQASFKHAIMPRLQYLAQRFNIPYEIVGLDWMYLTRMRSDLDPEYKPPPLNFGGVPTAGGMRGDLPQTMSEANHFGWLDGRNAFMYLAASIVAVHYGCKSLVTGMQANDDEIGDNTNESVAPGNDTNIHCMDRMNRLLYVSLGSAFVVTAPLHYFSKEQVYWLGLQWGVDMFETYSCDYYPRCGVCSQCNEVARLHAKYLYHVVDLHGAQRPPEDYSTTSKKSMKKLMDEIWDMRDDTEKRRRVEQAKKYLAEYTGRGFQARELWVNNLYPDF